MLIHVISIILAAMPSYFQLSWTFAINGNAI
jgi:hypothetical protein